MIKYTDKLTFALFCVIVEVLRDNYTIIFVEISILWRVFILTGREIIRTTVHALNTQMYVLSCRPFASDCAYATVVYTEHLNDYTHETM